MFTRTGGGGGGGHVPTEWEPPTSQRGQGSYPPLPNPQQGQGSYPTPPSSHINPPPPPGPPQEHRSNMAAPQQPQYHLPGPPEWHRPQDAYHHQQLAHVQHPPPGYQHNHQPPAPRQRTAIACRYCRRRKIRCTGFENADEGRCTNCVRFNQDCIFTPVSAQTQAFVPVTPAHYRSGQPPPELFGAFGQPLRLAHPAPPIHPGAVYAQAPPPPGYPQAPPGPGYAQPPYQQPHYLPSPTVTPGPYPAHSAYSPHSGSEAYDERSSDAYNARKRPSTEPHAGTLPPPNPALTSQLSQRPAAGQEYTYADPTSLTSSVSPERYPSYPGPHAPPQHQPYYTAPQPPRRPSPQSPYQTAPRLPGTSLHPVVPPPRTNGRTPPPPIPSSASSGRTGLRINDIVSENNGPSRNPHDEDMLNQLTRQSK